MFASHESSSWSFGWLLWVMAVLAGGCGDPPLIPDDPDPRVPDPDPRVPPEPEQPAPHESTNIELWYGPDQTFGQPGIGAPQRWVNVVGRINEPTARASVYSLNGGPEVSFPLGRDGARLISSGDFNLELDRDELLPLPEENTVDLFVETAEQTLWRRVTLRLHEPEHPQPERMIDWTAVDGTLGIQREADVVDGLWETTPRGVRTSEVGYDRLLALGSRTWSGNYEVVAEFIVHLWHNWGGIGVAVGWQGHDGTESPRLDWPLEALGWIRKVVPQPEIQLKTFRRGVLAHQEFDLREEEPYRLRLRTERTSQGPHVQLSVWRASEDEPPTPQLSAQAPEHDGSVLLVAHHADVTWVSVQISPVR